MIFERALRRELISIAGAVFTTLFTITVTILLIKILGQAAGGKIASADVVAMLGFAALSYSPYILILTGFISVLLVVTRSYQDSEMVVWFAAGLGLTRWIKPVLSFGLPVVFLTGLLSFVVTPWANEQSAEFRERFAKREDIARVSPGRFQESASQDRVFFVEGISGAADKVRNIFVNTREPNGKTSIVVAKEGTTELDRNGDKFLVLHQGRRYDGMPTQSDFQLMEFERYGLLISRQSQALAGNTSAGALPTMALLAAPDGFNLGELLWRIATPLMALLLMLLAIPLGFVNPRGGRSANMLIALMLAVVYSNLISVVRVAVIQGKLSFAMGWWPVHAVVLLMAVFLFSWRINVNSPYHPLTLWARFKRSAILRQAQA
ncbi:LPS export ABC transporter permease LptF [Janthinobacterium sp. 17J80-10]|uniref:LPS export ABC transporter permease LptF n=1 Tax=Janthinobacterium sp. 17J80-10 TaxID=2497863 RepID=UPI0010059343|nr:LPS export ABC transporter permease LptF [Janthinobacterium sp. 17J80-10]QAU34159.1 LPS export ABC transporter permease LptF [Janthinobacterium sp. 17J80-10]